MSLQEDFVHSKVIDDLWNHLNHLPNTLHKQKYNMSKQSKNHVKCFMIFVHLSNKKTQVDESDCKIIAKHFFK